MTKKIVIAVVALVVGFGAGFILKSNSGEVGSVRMSADKFTQGLFAGLTDQFSISNSGDFQSSGIFTANGGINHSSVYATSTQGDTVLSESQIDGVESIVVSPLGAVGDDDVTLPAVSNLTSMIPAVGDWVEINIVNSTTTLASSITLVGNTGVTLQNASTSSVLYGGKAGLLRLVRVTASSVVAHFTVSY